MKNRKLKIEYKWRTGKWRTLSVVPKIMLTGKWLAEAGFSAGDDVQVVVENGCLTLRPLAAG